MSGHNTGRSIAFLGIHLRVPSFRTALILWILAVAAVACGSLLPAATLHRMHYDSLAINDKVIHFLGYSVLALLPVALIEFLGMGIALAASMIPMGIAIEFLQRLVPGRSFEIGDMVADGLGVIAGMLIALSIRRTLIKPAVEVA